MCDNLPPYSLSLIHDSNLNTVAACSHGRINRRVKSRYWAREAATLRRGIHQPRAFRRWKIGSTRIAIRARAYGPTTIAARPASAAEAMLNIALKDITSFNAVSLRKQRHNTQI